jgi:hypothetical protein
MDEYCYSSKIDRVLRKTNKELISNQLIKINHEK